MSKSKSLIFKKIVHFKAYYIMFLPAFIMYILFNYLPMYGVKIAFYEYGIFGVKGFIGLDNFRELIANANFLKAFRNTIILSLSNLLLGMVLCIVLALLLNEIKNKRFKSIVQTVVYLPHFLSWVVVASIFFLLLSPETGIVNAVLKMFGMEPVFFLVSEKWWRPIFLFISRWKDTGWGTIIYLAALTSISPSLYEAASIDGANRLKKMLYITIPSLIPTMLIVLILNLSKVLNIFEPVFVTYNPLVYEVADVIGTFTYRVGLVQGDYDFSTAVGLFKSIVSMFLVLGANYFSKRYRGRGII